MALARIALAKIVLRVATGSMSIGNTSPEICPSEGLPLPESFAPETLL